MFLLQQLNVGSLARYFCAQAETKYIFGRIFFGCDVPGSSLLLFHGTMTFVLQWTLEGSPQFCAMYSFDSDLGLGTRDRL